MRKTSTHYGVWVDGVMNGRFDSYAKAKRSASKWRQAGHSAVVKGLEQPAHDPLDDDRDQSSPVEYSADHDFDDHDFDNDPDWR